jgi:hypothetical protein
MLSLLRKFGEFVMGSIRFVRRIKSAGDFSVMCGFFWKYCDKSGQFGTDALECEPSITMCKVWEW